MDENQHCDLPEVESDLMHRRLEELAGDRAKKVQLTRLFPGDPTHYGLVLRVGAEWVVIAVFHDFYPEGYTACRIRDVVEVHSGKREQFWAKMLAAEGLLDRIADPGDVGLDSTRALLSTLQARGRNIIVECEDPDDDEDDVFLIGQILDVTVTSLSFTHFDSLGRWDDAPRTIPLEDITQVQFESPYVEIFSRHLEVPSRRR
jgi:hypothetical protein